MRLRVVERGVVLALLLIAFAGPWGTSVSPRGQRPAYFPALVEAALKDLGLLSLCVAAIVAVPIACLSTILAPSSRLRVIIYRVLACATAMPFLVFLMLAQPRLEELRETWGVTLYTAAVLAAVVVEFVPVRRMRQPEYADVFR
jgi:hypothetical protein